MTAPIINVKNLNYSYEKTPVLHGLTFDIEKNSFFIIIGPNGSGKSTLLKILSGILNTPGTEIDIKGKPILHYTRKTLAQTVALVTQNFTVDFPFAVLDVVLMGRSPHIGLLGIEQKKDHDIALQSLAFTSVAHLAHRKMDQLSGGEQQRVFISRAICQEPEIIMLDEPTASLDLAHQVRIMDLMEKLKEEKGITVVMVSHDVNLAAMYADTLLLMNNGNIAQIGPPNEVVTYKNLEEIYGTTLLVDRNPLGDYPRITLVPQKHLKG